MTAVTAIIGIVDAAIIWALIFGGAVRLKHKRNVGLSVTVVFYSPMRFKRRKEDEHG